MNKMETMEVKKLVLSMSFPIMISMLVQALYNIVDSMFVAQYSQDSLLAISLCYPIQTILVAVAVGICVGFNTVLSRYLGQKEIDKANLTLVHGILIALFNWLIFALFGIFFSQKFIAAFTSDINVLNQSVTYLRIVTCCSFGVFIQITYERILQATGNAFYNMVMQASGAIINMILDPIFIFGFSLGVKGAAIATVIGQTCAMFIGIFIVQKKVKDIHFTLKGFYISKEILMKIYKIGIPAILMQSVVSVMTVFMNKILMQFSNMAISVFNIYYKLQQFVFMAVCGITNAIVPIVAYNHGAKLNKRILEAVQFSLTLTMGIMLVGTIVFQLFPSQLMNCFNPNIEMLKIGIPMLQIVSLHFIFAGINMVLCSTFQALNKANVSLFITLLRQLVLLLPMFYISSQFFGLNLSWYSFLITEAICCAISLSYWLKTKRQLENELLLN